MDTDMKAEEIAKKAIKVASQFVFLQITILQWKNYKMSGSKKLQT